MQGEQKQFQYTMIAFICAAGVFFLSMLSQNMAASSGGLVWFVLSVALTFALGIAGTLFILQSLKIEGPEEKTFLSKALISLRALAILAIGLGFLWTTFTIGASF